MSGSIPVRDGALLLRKASTLYTSSPVSWLTTRLHFSFAEYYDPGNVDFGVLRVLNDDVVKVRPTPIHPRAEIAPSINRSVGFH